MNPKFYPKISEISSVVRYHQSPGPVQQTIAAHSWGVAWLITEFHPGPSVSLIRAALEHDLEEHITSDVSYISKKNHPPLHRAMESAAIEARKTLGITSVDCLTTEDIWWLKWADLMEGALWSRHLYEEYGFRKYLRTWEEYLKALENHTEDPPVSIGPNAWALNVHIKTNTIYPR